MQNLDDNYARDTIQAKAENYLISIGITSAEIKKIRSIFLDEFSISIS